MSISAISIGGEIRSYHPAKKWYSSNGNNCTKTKRLKLCRLAFLKKSYSCSRQRFYLSHPAPMPDVVISPVLLNVIVAVVSMLVKQEFIIQRQELVIA